MGFNFGSVQAEEKIARIKMAGLNNFPNSIFKFFSTFISVIFLLTLILPITVVQLLSGVEINKNEWI